MTPGEILRDYNQAEKKAKQIAILADLNNCEKKDIVRILKDQGADIPYPYDKSKAKIREENKQDERIAELETEIEELKAESKQLRAELDKAQKEYDHNNQMWKEAYNKLLEQNAKLKEVVVKLSMEVYGE